jgi:hypothetical protein
MRSLEISIDLILTAATMALGLTEPLTEMSTRNLPGGVKGVRRVRLTTSPPSVSRLPRENEMWEPRRLTTYGHQRPVTGKPLLYLFYLLHWRVLLASVLG